MRYLDLDATIAAMPPLAEQVRLAEVALIGVEEGGQVPGKMAVHPRSASSIAYAMPAAYAGRDQQGPTAIGVKWVTVFPANGGVGLPTVDSLMIMNDPATLEPTEIMNGGAITAARTAAVSGVIIRHFAPELAAPPIVAVVGAGVQGRSHLPMLGYLVPGATVRIYDRHADRAEALVDVAAGTPGIKWAQSTNSSRDAIAEADIIITAASFGPQRQQMSIEWLKRRCLVVAVDYDVYLSAEVADSASVFLVDELAGFRNSCEEGRFSGFPEPSGTIGSRLQSGADGHTEERAVVAHLGMGLTDVLFADAIARTARSMGVGLELPAGEAAAP